MKKSYSFLQVLIIISYYLPCYTACAFLSGNLRAFFPLVNIPDPTPYMQGIIINVLLTILNATVLLMAIFLTTSTFVDQPLYTFRNFHDLAHAKTNYTFVDFGLLLFTMAACYLIGSFFPGVRWSTLSIPLPNSEYFNIDYTPFTIISFFCNALTIVRVILLFCKAKAYRAAPQ